MNTAEGGVHKHTKAPSGTPAHRSGWVDLPARLRSTTSGKIAGYGLPAAGAGGLGAWFTAISTHGVSATALVAIAAMFASMLATHAVTKILATYFEHRKGIIEACEMAARQRIREETIRDLVLKGADDPSRADHVERMVIIRSLADLAQCELTGDQAATLGRLLTRYLADDRANRKGQDDAGGDELRRAI
jgi:hypothetical protein